ncbi:hypothetical protein J6590_106952, partial [Homalodisca vitripennis]
MSVGMIVWVFSYTVLQASIGDTTLPLALHLLFSLVPMYNMCTGYNVIAAFESRVSFKSFNLFSNAMGGSDTSLGSVMLATITCGMFAVTGVAVNWLNLFSDAMGGSGTSLRSVMLATITCVVCLRLQEFRHIARICHASHYNMCGMFVVTGVAVNWLNLFRHIARICHASHYNMCGMFAFTGVAVNWLNLFSDAMGGSGTSLRSVMLATITCVVCLRLQEFRHIARICHASHYNMCGMFAVTGVAVNWLNLFSDAMGGSGTSLGSVMLMFFVQMAVYMIITWYVTSIHPGPYGRAEPWWFPCKSGQCGTQSATRFNMTEEVRELRRAVLCVCSPCSVHGVGVCV